MLRPFRLMSLVPRKDPSPNCVFSATNTRFLHALDAEAFSSTTNDDDAFGSEWPSRQSTATVNTSSVGDTSQSSQSSTSATIEATGTLRQWPPVRSRAKSKMMDAESSTRPKSVLKSSIGQPSSISSSSVVIPIPKPVLKCSKENGFVQSVPQIILEPAIMHPLPLYSYKDYNPAPVRVYVRHEEEANDLVEALSGAVGFDIEWKVLFRKGTIMRPAATVQLSDRRMILIIQVSAMTAFPVKLKAFLENPKIAKVGVNILNDGNKLARDYGVRSQGLIELGGLARQADTHYVERYFRASAPPQNATLLTGPSPKMRKPGRIISLAVVTAMYTGRTLSKGAVRTSDWEAQPLNEVQLEYAANDAHSALMVHGRLVALAKAENVRLEPAKYTTSVKTQSGVVSDGTSALLPPPPAPPFPAPVLDTAASSSSSASASTSASGYDADSSSSASRSTTSAVIKLADPSTTRTKLKSVFSLTYAPVNDGDIRAPSKRSQVPERQLTFAGVSDSDVEVLEIRDYRAVNRPILQPKKTLAIASASLATESTAKSLPKPRPRFKPSYDAIVMPRSDPPPASTTSRPPILMSQMQTRYPPPALHPPPRPTNQCSQHIRAYNLWHVRQLPLPEICSALRSRDNPLKNSTVISYVISALRTDPNLHFSRERLRVLLDSNRNSWLYHGEWFNTLDARRHVNMDAEAATSIGTETGTGSRG